MATRRKLILSISGLLLALIILPLIIPIPPLEGVSPPRELADPDSRFIYCDASSGAVVAISES